MKFTIRFDMTREQRRKIAKAMNSHDDLAPPQDVEKFVHGAVHDVLKALDMVEQCRQSD